MKRYNIWAEGDPHESELIIEENRLGKWVKFADLKDIKSRDARMIKLHSKINELTHELELTKERLHLVKRNSAPLSVVQETLKSQFLKDVMGEALVKSVMADIKKKSGL